MQQFHIGIIGAGVIGAATALALQRDGHKVTLLDRDAPAAGASGGNAGVIVSGVCAPTLMPGSIRRALEGIGNAAAPVTVRPAYLTTALPWLVRSLWDSRPSRREALSRALFALSHDAADAWRRLADATPAAALLEPSGWLRLYETQASFDGAASVRGLLDANEAPYEILKSDEIQDLEPHLAPIFEAGLLTREALCIRSPRRLVEALVEQFSADGGRYRRFEVTAVRATPANVRIVGSGDTLQVDKAVIAAGAWSGPLAEQVGNRLPLEAERGYHLDFPQGSESLVSQPLLNADRGLILSPLADGLRMTGLVEFAGSAADADFTRIRALVAQASRMLPALQTEARDPWMGCRPSLPDSLPVIGPSAASENVLLAFGHQHIGMTLGAVTARMVADLVAARDSGMDLTPYSAERY